MVTFSVQFQKFLHYKKFYTLCQHKFDLYYFNRILIKIIMNTYKYQSFI